MLHISDTLNKVIKANGDELWRHSLRVGNEVVSVIEKVGKTKSKQKADRVAFIHRDLQAGVVAGCKPVLVKTGKGEKSLQTLKQNPELNHTQIFSNLKELVNSLDWLNTIMEQCLFLNE